MRTKNDNSERTTQVSPPTHVTNNKPLFDSHAFYGAPLKITGTVIAANTNSMLTIVDGLMDNGTPAHLLIIKP